MRSGIVYLTEYKEVANGYASATGNVSYWRPKRPLKLFMLDKENIKTFLKSVSDENTLINTKIANNAFKKFLNENSNMNYEANNLPQSWCP